MNDYLSQLVATSQATANVIQPRIASRFEPVVSAPAVISETHETPTAARIESQQSNEQNERRVPTLPAASEMFSRSSYPATETRLVVEADSTRLDFNQPGSRLIAPPIIQPDVLRREASQREPAERLIQRGGVETQRTVVNEKIMEIAPVTEIESRRQIVPMSEPVLATEYRAPASMVVQPRIVPSDQASPQAPVIRVTIGRIEVRANMPTPTPPSRIAPPAPTPRVSLDEYLKAQRRGDR